MPGKPQPRTKPTGVTVRTKWVEDVSAYLVSIEPAEGLAVTLTDDLAFNHARAVLFVAHQAAHDAAALAQLTEKMLVPRSAAATMLQIMQREHPPPNTADTEPLRYEPGVDAKAMKPFVTVSVGATAVGRWSVTEADDHARTIIGYTERARRETVYRQFLTSQGMEEYRAKNAVADLGTFRKY